MDPSWRWGMSASLYLLMLVAARFFALRPALLPVRAPRGGMAEVPKRHCHLKNRVVSFIFVGLCGLMYMFMSLPVMGHPPVSLERRFNLFSPVSLTNHTK